MTSKSSWPTPAWLSYAVTAKARTHIRNHLKAQTREDALNLGKRLLAGATKQRLFGRRKISMLVRAKLLQQLKLETWSDLLVDIGLGVRLPDLVARQIAQLSGEGSAGGKVLGQETLVIKGAEGLLVTYSKCCCPIPGDSILGIFTAGHGLVVHTTDCPNIIELRKQSDRTLMVEWDEELDQEFQAKLQIKLENKTGTFAVVASAIAENECNINHVDLHETPDNIKTIDFIIEVKDRTHLARIIKAIRKVKEVTKVVRMKG